MSDMIVNPVGKVIVNEEGMSVKVKPEYIQALKELDGFSHLNVIWWFDECDNTLCRDLLEVDSPYKNSPDVMGIFATRSPARPNPVAFSTSQIIDIDHEKGIIHLAYIDANNNSPVIDLKPYTPSLDRVESPSVPAWCSHWPNSIETSGDFDWQSEFNFPC